jgi:hypothetical protein
MVRTTYILLFLAINLVFHAANCQFYVDIEHSMPRIGKRVKDILASNSILDQIEYSNDMTENNEDTRVLLAKAVELIKFLSRKNELKRYVPKL